MIAAFVLSDGENQRVYVLIEVHCPRCDTLLEVPEAAAGRIIACPHCDADVSVPVPASAQIIDVHAEGLNDPESETGRGPSPYANGESGSGFGGPELVRGIFVQRTSNNSGCCMLGCLGVLLFVFLAIRGFFSLFH